ncbi:hypothetical protein [Streptomyces nigrescens]|uniref:Uncharacterized protein n=1 Tax=Streptomyces nigrescens TaxID=1920 RepID=A0A640TAD7_STRNI|nr:hypothetical protein [Streptomyces libani]WAT94986.1 hypothetical protein STRLI_000659 [Streptomyces libani subsp. libani]GFE20144.1 hypothetical protein Sliba_05970 [Streptomyces libani subsp. libani]GGV85976.1 hypothetical protein GCM10010500_03410 [Streptomyces libani subsp. libani]
MLTAFDQARGLRLIAEVGETHPHLPAAEVHVHRQISLVAELTVDVVLHGDELGFAQWQRALGITKLEEPRPLSLGGWVTSGHVTHDGITVVLTLHHRQDAPPARALAAVA